MSSRTKSRKRALDVLYAADIRGLDLATALTDEDVRVAGETDRAMQWAYAAEIVRGVIDHRPELDELITTYARDWPLDRMPAIDRALLRIGSWEIAYNPEVPNAVAVSEAVDAAATLSTEDSAKFINGVLGRIAAAHG